MNETLSPTELSFWYQYKYDPSSDAQNIIHRVTLSRQYDEKHILSSVASSIRKHPILRTRFKEVEGVPVRTTLPAPDFEYINGSTLDEAALLTLARKPFVLEEDSLLRLILVQNDTSTIVWITIPHIIFDASSWNILSNELFDRLEGLPINTTEIPSRYQPYQDTAQEYWKERLSSASGRVDLTHTNQKQRSAPLSVYTDTDTSLLIDRLIEFGKQHALSINTLCMTIVSIVLSKTTNANQMIVATPVTTRDEDTTHMIGSYINVLPSVFNLQPNDTLLDYATASAAAIWDDIENRNLSLMHLINSGSVAQYGDGQGIYNIMAEYVPESPLHSIVLEDSIIPNDHAKLDVIFSVIAHENTPVISVEFNAAKLSKEHIQTIVECFKVVTESLLELPNQTLQETRFMSAQEEQFLINIGRGPTKEVSAPFIWNRFQDTARTHPDLVAINDGDTIITYKELLDIATNYAGHMQASGVKKNRTVGIYMDRGVEYIASMLALWSLGAIYVPLDPQQPIARLQSMIHQAAVEFVIHRGDSPVFEESVRHLNIDQFSPTTSFQSNYEPQAEDTAYIIFTSGSTGTPKGVIIKHIGFLNHLEIMIDTFAITPTDVVAQSAPPSFDISVWQLVGPLIVGASLTIISRDELIDPDVMYGIIKEKSITILEIVPSLIAGYLANESDRADLAGRLKNLKLITTGEAISTQTVLQWTTLYPSTPLYNAYGPAEGSDDTHIYTIDTSTLKLNGSIPIGKPLQNVHTYIVNQDMQLVPNGFVGEIYLGGPIVAGGYINDIELTSRSFVTNTISEIEGMLYRTGDYGTWDQDGMLIYHGRKDHQVKVRGQRLELGEVEEQLKNVQGIEDAAVITATGPSGTILKGYVTTNETDLSSVDIKNRLHPLLPDFMIPQTLSILPSLPRSGNGKLDRKALEQLELDIKNIPTMSEAAEHPLTLQTIIDVYKEVLQTPVNKDSNYFDCGGDSLQSMRIASLLAARNIIIGIRDILHYQTPLELATYLDTQSANERIEQSTWKPLDGYTPIQHSYLENTGSKNIDSGEAQAALIRLAHPLTSGELREYLGSIASSHAELTPLNESTPLVVEHTRQSDVPLNTLADELRNHLSLKHPLVGCIVSEDTVLVVAHHFVFDFYSWKTFENELTEMTLHKTQPQFEDHLKKWWGNAKKTLEDSPKRIQESLDFWLPTHTNISPSPFGQLQNTQHTALSVAVPADIPTRLNASGVTVESLSYYLYTLANANVGTATSFSYSIESSLRSIDTTSTLKDSIGWMTYLFPQTIARHSPSKAGLHNYHQTTVEALRRGYEYGLLKYSIRPNQFLHETPSIWTLNYLGNALEGERTSLIHITPMKTSPFVEIDIQYNGKELLFNHYYNVAIPESYFTTLHTEMEKSMQLLNTAYESSSKVTLSTDRSSAILERLINANRN